MLYGSYALSRPPLPDGPATMHAEIAREMVSRNDWANPSLNGVPIQSSSKALDWSIAASYRLFGVGDWSARLPIALCVLALAVTVFFLARSLFVWNAAGLYSALFLLSWPGTFLATRDLTTAPLLCLETTLIAALLWQLLVVQELPLWSGAGVTAAACAVVLLTGRWPAILPTLAIAAACWVVRRIDHPLKQARWPLLAWAVCAILFAIWLEPNAHRPLSWLGPIPPLALLVGGWLASEEAFSSRRVDQLALNLVVVAVLAAALLGFVAFHGPSGLTIFQHTLLITSSPASRVPLLVAAAALLAGSIGYWLFRRRNRIRIANCFLAGMLAGLVVAIQVGLVIASPRFSSQILADAIRPELDPTDLVVVDGKYPEASSLAFYLERPVLIALPPSAGTVSLFASTQSRGMVDVSQVWAGTARVFLWTSDSRPLSVPGQSFIVARSGGKQILSNQPNSAGAAF